MILIEHFAYLHTLFPTEKNSLWFSLRKLVSRIGKSLTTYNILDSIFGNVKEQFLGLFTEYNLYWRKTPVLAIYGDIFYKILPDE